MTNYLEKIKQFVGSFLLERKYNPSRSKRFIPLASAKSVIILYDAGIPENDLVVRKMKEAVKTVTPCEIHVVGYKHQGHHMESYMPDSANSYLSRKDFNFFYQPANETVKKLITSRYDVLFLLSAKPLFPLIVLARHIPAAFKAGRSNIADPDLDFLIDQPHEQSLEVLGENLFFHLNMLKAKSQSLTQETCK